MPFNISSDLPPSKPQPTSIAWEIEEAGNRYARDEIDEETLDAELDFWLGAQECERCTDTQLCSRHYDWFLGYP